MQTNIDRPAKRGMWVVTDDGRVGILTGIAPLCGVDLVDEAGETTLAVQVPFESLRQATLAEIPEPRRPDPADGAPLGYL